MRHWGYIGKHPFSTLYPLNKDVFTHQPLRLRTFDSLVKRYHTDNAYDIMVVLILKLGILRTERREKLLHGIIPFSARFRRNNVIMLIIISK